MDSLEILKIAAKVLDDKKAQAIEAIKVDDLTTLTDYFLIASGSSSTQVKALAEEIEYKLNEMGVRPHHIEGRSSTWILLDYTTVIINVFYYEAREFYSFERLWADGEQIPLDKIIEA